MDPKYPKHFAYRRYKRSFLLFNMATRPGSFLEEYEEAASAGEKTGKQHVLFRKNGEIYTMDITIRNGKRNGNAKMVDYLGSTVESLIYKDGHLNGVCKHHYNNGMVRMECMVVNDVMEGEFTEYDETGEVICSGKYVKGRRIVNGEDEDDPKDESQSSSGFGTAVAAGATAAAATGAATGAAGAAAAIAGFGSPGIAAGSIASGIMSISSTTGIGAGLVSAAQSAGALFMNAVGGSVLAAGAAVAAPIVAGIGVAGGIYYYKNRKNRMNNQ